MACARPAAALLINACADTFAKSDLLLTGVGVRPPNDSKQICVMCIYYIR